MIEVVLSLDDVRWLTSGYQLSEDKDDEIVTKLLESSVKLMLLKCEEGINATAKINRNLGPVEGDDEEDKEEDEAEQQQEEEKKPENPESEGVAKTDERQEEATEEVEGEGGQEDEEDEGDEDEGEDEDEEDKEDDEHEEGEKDKNEENEAEKEEEKPPEIDGPAVVVEGDEELPELPGLNKPYEPKSVFFLTMMY